MSGLIVLLGLALGLLILLGTFLVISGVTRPPRKTFAKALANGDATDPAELDWQAEAVTVRLTDGATSPGWLIAGDAPSGPGVVIIHGFGDSRYGALSWAGLLKPHASRLLVYDQRGQGESGAAHCGGGRLETRDALAAIEQHLPTGPVVLFGYSMGGQIALAIAAATEGAMRQRLVGVVADGVYRRWDVPVRQMMRCQGYPPQPMLWLAERFLHWASGGATRFDRCEDAAAMSCPLLLLHGEADPLCPIEDARAIAHHAREGQIITIAEGGHLDLATRAPQRYRQAIQDFFDRLPAATPAASV
jgi:pimeloyl-ACP methyl ester carboxylesterase